MKNAAWDFSMGGSQSTDTSRSAPKPPQARKRKPDVSYNQATPRKVSDSGSQWSSEFRNAPDDSLVKDARHQGTNHEDEELSASGSGTVVVRSPKGSQSSSQLHDQSRQAH